MRHYPKSEAFGYQGAVYLGKKYKFDPDEDRICTSHAERHNLSIRMHVRRLTRLTNAFSKKWENHEAMLALFFMFYNYCRPHMSLARRTPAMAAGLTCRVWSIRKLLDETATQS